MSLLFRGLSRKTVDLTSLTWDAIFGTPASKAGVAVNVDSALRVAGVLGCMRVVAEDIAQLPFKVYQEQKSGRKDVALQHPLNEVLSLRPNEIQTSFQWRETSIYHAGLAGGAFAIPNRVGPEGEVYELLPVPPGNVSITQGRDYKTVIEVRGDGTNVVGVFDRADVFCLQGPGWNGYRAFEMVRLAADTIGLATVTAEAQAKLHANGARPGGILSYPNALTQQQRTDIAAAWRKAFGGEQAFGTAVLDLGVKYERLSMTGIDAQTLEARKHELEEICRIFRVFPQMIGFSDKTSTYASAEQFFTAHVIYTLGPWIARFEQEVDNRLLTPKERKNGLFAKFSVQALLRGDHKARAEFYKASLGTASSPGWNSPNDIRRLEDQDPSTQDGADLIVTADRMSGSAQPRPTPDRPQPTPPDGSET